jgi:pilus assembly protein CpaF
MGNIRDLLFADAEVAATPKSSEKKPAAQPTGSATGGYSLSPAGTRKVHTTDFKDELKARIHRRLLESIELSSLLLQDEKSLAVLIEQTVQQLLAEEKLPLTNEQKQELATAVLNETLGLGPLEPLLQDPDINDILVNGFDNVWVDRNGRLVPTEIRFKDEEHLLHVVGRVVARVGRRIDESSPIVDARLPDGSRVNAIIPPLSLDGPLLSIRRFRPTPFEFEDLVKSGAISEQMSEFLRLAVQARLNIMVSGGTSAGKTTLLNVLSGHISNEERIITIEDTAELRLQQRHVLRLESRPSNVEGRGAVAQRELVKNALRMRPDRIVVGEVRGPEALDMLQAMNTGHEGSLTTIHANSARDALSRLETLVLLSGIELHQRSIREQIASALDLIVQVKRLPDGTRKVVGVSEVTGVQESMISLQDLYLFKQTELTKQGKVVGTHNACGLRPYVEHKFRDAGITLPASLFEGALSE